MPPIDMLRRRDTDCQSAPEAPGIRGLARLLHARLIMRHQHTAPISHIIEATLRQPNGTLLGHVDELLIDLASGRIEYVMARSVNGQRLRYHWDAISVDAGGFILRRTGPRLVLGDDSQTPGSTRRKR